MKKIFKRVSAAVMALAVAATAVVFDVPEKMIAAAAVSRSLSSGDYRIDRGTLTINSDTGMTDWKNNGFRESDVNTVTEVNMDSSVTSIPEGAFGFCQNLTSVEIGSGVQTIDANAFYNCSSLTEITVANGNSKYSSTDGVLFNTDKTQLICYPEGKQGSSYEIPSTVTSIEQSAFENCQLTSVTAAAGSRLTTIKDYAFRNCRNLASITIPEGVTSLGINAFNSCGFQDITIPASLTSMSIDESHGTPFINCKNLTAINVAAGNTAYSSENGVLFNKNKTKLICCPEGTEDGYEIPNTVTSVGTWAFYACKKLASMTIPNTVTSIGDKAFAFCTALTSVTIPDTVTSIGDEMFSNCYKLASVTIPNSVTSIGNKAFYNCYNDQFTSVTIPKSVNSIGDEAFSDCSKLTTVTFKSTTPPTIGNNIFYQYTNKLEKIMVPARSVDTYKAVSNLDPYKDKIVEGEADNPCGDNATWEYDETTKTLTISGTGTMTDWTSSSDVPWKDKAADIQNVVIEEGITSVGKYAFKGCSSLTSVTIPDGVDSIGSWAFDGCTELTSITIPSSVTSIKTYAFQNCSQLTSITIPRGSRLANIGLRAFYNCSCLTAIDIPVSVTSISQEAFSGCTSLMSITIPNGVTSISSNTFNGCSSLSSITIPNSVTYIGANAFYNCSSLTSITIPNDVTSIDDRAFSGCSSLSSITIPGKVATIGVSTFSNCTSLSSITIPNSVNKIYATAFSGCTNLKTVTFENATPPATIGTTLFDNCSKLEKIFVPAGSAETYKGLERLDPYKDKIFEVAAENSCGTNATWALDETTKTLTISGTGDMSNWVASGNIAPWLKDTGNIGKIKNVVINEGITSVGNYAFCRCLLLTSVTIPSSVTFIGDCAFNSCSALTSITIPSSVTSIGSSAFFNCGNLTSITIPKDVRSIGTSAFDRCSKLSEIIYKDGLDVSRTSIPDTATKVEYTVNNSKLNVTEITLGTNKTSLTVTDAMNISSVAENYREKVSQEGHTHIYSGDVCQICDYEKPDNTGGDNTGGDNTGGDNTGGDNTGGDNTGGDNTGGDNTGGGNTGGGNTGGGNTGGGNTGDGNTGDDNTSGGNSSFPTNANTSKDVQLGENVPKTEFAAPTEELISAVFDPEELAQLKDTDRVSIVLEVVENVPAGDKQSVDSFLESGSNVLAQYMDVALYKVINDSKTQITSTNKPIRITLEVPEGLRAAGRTFAVLRVHNGETVLLSDLDNDANTVTIETDRFSTYALVYRDNAPAAGDDNHPTGITVSLAPLLTAAAFLIVAVKLKKK